MRLTMYTDYALRLLMFLALEPDNLATIQEAAAAYGISRNHLMKVAQELGRAGFVETVRGRGGGLRLGRKASEIKVGDVVRATEEDFRIVECFDPGRNRCVITGPCRLRGVLREALEAYLTVLDRYTVADLVVARQPLMEILDIPSAPRLSERGDGLASDGRTAH